MSRLPMISGDEFARGAEDRFSAGSYRGQYMILLHASGRRPSVPRHRELGRGLLGKLIRQAEIDRDEFIDLL